MKGLGSLRKTSLSNIKPLSHISLLLSKYLRVGRFLGGTLPGSTLAFICCLCSVQFSSVTQSCPTLPHRSWRSFLQLILAHYKWEIWVPLASRARKEHRGVLSSPEMDRASDPESWALGGWGEAEWGSSAKEGGLLGTASAIPPDCSCVCVLVASMWQVSEHFSNWPSGWQVLALSLALENT